TPMPHLPSPSQSPTTGCQPAPGVPKTNEPASGTPESVLLRRYQVAVAGTNIPMPKEPSPSQSPVTGIQFTRTKEKAGMSIDPLVWPRTHTASRRLASRKPLVSTTPLVVFPSPSQSPLTGFQSCKPETNEPASGGPLSLLLRR